MKAIKIQNNTNVLPIYNAENIESVIIGNEPQKVKYSVIDEYTLPIATYAEVFNYVDADFSPTGALNTTKNFAKVTNMSNSSRGWAIYDIAVTSEKPSCKYVDTVYNQNKKNHESTGSDTGWGVSYSYEGTFFINTSEDVYYKINIETASPSSGTLRITDIELGAKYDDIEYAKEMYANVIVLDFDEILPMCGMYWYLESNKKTSAFDTTPASSAAYSLSTFVSGYGATINQGSGTGTAENVEYWKRFSSPGNGKMLNGQYYLCDEGDEDGIEVKDYKYNIYDVLFRYIHDYLYDYNNLNSSGEPTVNNPTDYTFLLKAHKIYIRKTVPDRITQDTYNNYYSASVLSEEEIKTLSPEEAQDYFYNTIPYSPETREELILSPNTAYSKINEGASDNTCGIKCNKYFLISQNLCVNEANRSENETYIDLGNFKLFRAECLDLIIERNSAPTTYICKSNTKITKSREVYDPWNKEYLVISQNNSGGFADDYEIDRISVTVKGISSKKDVYYFDTTADGKTAAEQLADDIAYAIEDGPSIVSCANIATIYSE